MKTIILVITLACAALAKAQEPISFVEVVEVENMTANQLYTLANEWFALIFNDANKVIQMNDPESKQIIAKGNTESTLEFGRLKLASITYFTIKCQFKDGRYRYEFMQISTKLISGNEYTTLEEWKLKSTYDGMMEYYKTNSINPNMIGKKGIEKNAADCKHNYETIVTDIQLIATDLKNYLTKIKQDNW
jgi:hypothetical protein